MPDFPRGEWKKGQPEPDVTKLTARPVQSGSSWSFLPFENSTLTFKADTDNINPIPEPATLLLFATGLAGLAAAGRRRRI